MNEELSLLWLDLLQASLKGASTSQGIKAETLAKKAAAVADAALDQYRTRFELPPETSPGADGKGSEGE